MPYDVEIGDGATALDQNQLTDALDGTYWVSGWDATLGTGDLEVDIAAGSGAINGGDVSTGAVQTVDFTGDPDPDDPRKAVISVDDTGTVQKTLGTAVPAAPTDEIRFRTFDPAPPTNAPGVVVAEVWLAAGETVLESGDVRDRRVSNDSVEEVQPIPNEPNWQEDPNSPISMSGSQSETITLANTYDSILVRIQEFVNISGGTQELQIRVNNITTDSYNYTLVDGSRTVNNSAWVLANTFDDGAISGQFRLEEDFSGSTIQGPIGRGRSSSTLITGFVADTSSLPINSITFRGEFGAVSIKARVYGWNGGL